MRWIIFQRCYATISKLLALFLEYIDQGRRLRSEDVNLPASLMSPQLSTDFNLSLRHSYRRIVMFSCFLLYTIDPSWR